MNHKWCSHCRIARPDVNRYRLAFVGLRYLCDECNHRLDAMGMQVVRVTDEDPRATDRGRQSRVRAGIGRRLSLWMAA